MGISGDAAAAVATATRPPATVTRPTSASDSAASLPRGMPRARRTGNSTASRLSWRLSSWAITASATRPAKAANTASAIACGRIARSTAVTSSARSTASILPPVAG